MISSRKLKQNFFLIRWELVLLGTIWQDLELSWNSWWEACQNYYHEFQEYSRFLSSFAKVFTLGTISRQFWFWSFSFNSDKKLFVWSENFHANWVQDSNETSLKTRNLLATSTKVTKSVINTFCSTLQCSSKVKKFNWNENTWKIHGTVLDKTDLKISTCVWVPFTFECGMKTEEKLCTECWQNLLSWHCNSQEW